MDQTDQLIVRVEALELPKLVIETSYNKKYTSDLSAFKGVHCFPKTQQDWEDVSISTGGYALTWGCRFEVHVDQIIPEAVSVENIDQASGN
jgi:hypothetical protein